jgi:CRISPR-associated protein Csx10
MAIEALSYVLYVPGDMHIGTGMGLPGLIDEHIVRDHRGFTYVPGSHIKGLVRDSCVQLLNYLGKLKDICQGQRDRLEDKDLPYGLCGFLGQSPCVICAIFGSPATPAGFWFSPAEYEPDYRNAVREADPSLAWRDMFTSAHAAIDPQTKRAAEYQLFSLEVARPVAAFRGRIEPLPALTEAKVNETELLGWLTASLLFTRHLGGRRRRGWGRCRFELDQSEPSTVASLAALRELLKEGDDGGS